jgi:SAM-dependent methyltransferase
MNHDVYKRHIENQSTHWWFQARKKIIETIIKNKFKKKLEILDFGSGSGVNVKMFSKFGFVNIYEPHNKTRFYLKKKFRNKKRFNVLNNFPTKKFDLIIMADVLEHIKDDKGIIKKLSNHLKKGGYILVTVPAFQLLFSKKDVALGHFRRYNLKDLKIVFKRFEQKRLTYFNFFLFFPISFLILFFKTFKLDFINEVEKAPNFFVNRLMYSLFIIEKNLLRIINFPFGISILGLFRKND